MMNNEERDEMLEEMSKNLITHLAQTEEQQKSVDKLELAMWGNGRRGITSRMLLVEWGLGVFAIGAGVVFGAIVTWISGRL